MTSDVPTSGTGGRRIGWSDRSVGRVNGSEYEVVLLRHGETLGYDGDLGLTPRGEQQARERGVALAAELKPGSAVRMPHARTARAIATATVLREALAEALGGERVDGTELGPLYPSRGSTTCATRCTARASTPPTR